jgi:hypothetical protein
VVNWESNFPILVRGDDFSLFLQLPQDML